MSKRGVESWPTVPATIRLAATREPEDLSAGASSALRAVHVGGIYRLFQAILGHDTVFMYTFSVGGSITPGAVSLSCPHAGNLGYSGKARERRYLFGTTLKNLKYLE